MKSELDYEKDRQRTIMRSLDDLVNCLKTSDEKETKVLQKIQEAHSIWVGRR